MVRTAMSPAAGMLAAQDRAPLTPSVSNPSQYHNSLPSSTSTPGPGQGSGQLVPMHQSQPPAGSIPLSLLIDFIVQRTYHDLSILAEL